MAQETILVSDGSGVMFQHRLRCNNDGNDSWVSVVTNSPARDTVQNGSNSAASFLYRNEKSGTPGFYTVDRNYVSFDLSAIPSDATITAVSVFLTTDTTSRNITDSDAEKLRLVKSTNDDSVTAANGATTANAIDHTVNNGSDVTMGSSDNTSIEFDLGSSNLYSYVVAQHAAGNRANMYLLTKLEFDIFVDASATEPTAGGANRTGISGNTDSTTAHRPKIVIDFTEAPAPPNTKLNINAGSLKINGGNLKVI